MAAGDGVRAYGCYDREPFKLGYESKDGIVRDFYHHRVQNYAYVRHEMSTDCQYSKATEDARCVGCKWKQEEL